MTSRYSNTPFFRNRYALYDSIFEERGLRYINQYATTTHKKLSPSQIRNLSIRSDIWQIGSRLEKFSSLYYGDPRFWWIIAKYNNMPTDAHFKLGDVFYIPEPLSMILSYYLE